MWWIIYSIALNFNGNLQSACNIKYLLAWIVTYLIKYKLLDYTTQDYQY